MSQKEEIIAMKGIRSKEIKVFLWCILNIGILVFSAVMQGDILIVLLTIVFSNSLLYTLYNLEKRIVLFSFLCTFFVFLTGRQFLEDFGIYNKEITYGEQYEIHAKICMIISLVVVMVSYILIERRLSAPIEWHKSNYPLNTMVADLQTASCLLFYVSYTCLVLSVVGNIVYVQKHGYLSFYTADYQTDIPVLVQKIGDFCPTFFFVFLGTFPEKKKTIMPMLFYAMYAVLTIFTGSRYKFVASLFILIIYMFLRNNIRPGKTKWIGRKEILIIIAAMPLFMSFLYAYQYTRYGRDIVENGNAFFSFIYQQGVNANNIKRELYFEDQLPSARLYSFGQVIGFLKSNPIASLFGIQYYRGNTVEFALYGNSLGHAISYLAMNPAAYLLGNGMGSCYIAELYHDFGFFGIIAGNAFYGYAIFKMVNQKKYNWIIQTIMFSALYALLLAPRGSFDGIIDAFLDLSTWAAIIIVYIATLMLQQLQGRRKNV